MKQMKKKQTILYKTLNRALSLMRPHNTISTAFFTEWLLEHIPAHLQADAWQDTENNLHIDNRTHASHKTLFVAHVDTVHRKPGANTIRKTNAMWYADGAPLGADDGVGCALLMHLLHAGIPGYYIFTQGEEIGGIGSKHLAAQYPVLISAFDRAIAFDRRGTDSVITHQGWGRCCSDVFGAALAEALNGTNDMLMYSPDDSGVYTDTAEFTDIIPECTNISCGYQFEHSDKEQLDMAHFDLLADAVVAIDWDSLPTERDPEVIEAKPVTGNKWWESVELLDGMLMGSSTQKDYDYWTEDDALRECLLDAQQGFMTGIIDLMSESVYPEDANAAVRLIDRSKLTDEAITMALGMVGHNDAASILCTLFDVAYAA